MGRPGAIRCVVSILYLKYRIVDIPLVVEVNGCTAYGRRTTRLAPRRGCLWHHVSVKIRNIGHGMPTGNAQFVRANKRCLMCRIGKLTNGRIGLDKVQQTVQIIGTGNENFHPLFTRGVAVLQNLAPSHFVQAHVVFGFLFDALIGTADHDAFELIIMFQHVREGIDPFIAHGLGDSNFNFLECLVDRQSLCQLDDTLIGQVGSWQVERDQRRVGLEGLRNGRAGLDGQVRRGTGQHEGFQTRVAGQSLGHANDVFIFNVVAKQIQTPQDRVTHG
eukprot:scaffold24048_cov194-Amphora_coffeaeformis.AAC.14